MRYSWKVYAKDRYVDSGTIEADTQKIAMGLVLAGQAEKDRDPDTSYRVTVGDGMTSSFGDEFLRSAEACSWTAEPEMDGGGVAKPSLADIRPSGPPIDGKYTKGIPATIEDIARTVIEAVVLPKILSNLRDVGKPEDVVLKRVPVVGGEWVPVVEAPSEWISPPSGGSTYEQAKQASRELYERISSYPSGRMVGRGPNLQQLPKCQQLPANEAGTKGRMVTDAIQRAWIGVEEIDPKDLAAGMFGMDSGPDQVE